MTVVIVDKNFDDYDLKKQINLNEDEIEITTVYSPEQQLSPVVSEQRIKKHGRNEKKIKQRRTKNKLAKISRRKNRK